MGFFISKYFLKQNIDELQKKYEDLKDYVDYLKECLRYYSKEVEMLQNGLKNHIKVCEKSPINTYSRIHIPYKPSVEEIEQILKNHECNSVTITIFY